MLREAPSNAIRIKVNTAVGAGPSNYLAILPYPAPVPGNEKWAFFSGRSKPMNPATKSGAKYAKMKVPKVTLVFALVAIATALTARAQTILDDGDPSVVYSIGNNVVGGDGDHVTDWFTYSGSQDYGGGEHSSNLQRSGGRTFQGASVSVTFNGTGITWYGKKGPNYGMADWYVDGTHSGTFNGYSAGPVYKSANVSVSGLAAGPHVLTISLTDQTNGSDYYQTIDYFSIAGTALPLSAGTQVGTATPNGLNTAQLNFTQPSNWGWGWGVASDLSNGHVWCGSPGASITWQFNGSLIEVYGRPDLENGLGDIYIDNSYQTTIDMRWGSTDDDSLNEVLLYARYLGGNGQHTITISAEGANDGQPGQDRDLLQIDEFVSFSGSGGGGTPPITVGAPYNYRDPNGNAMDAGFTADNGMHTYRLNNLAQQQFELESNGTICNCGSGGTGESWYASGGLLYQRTGSGDTFTITMTASGSGYTVYDNTAGQYVNPAAERGDGYNVTLSSSASVWTLTRAWPAGRDSRAGR
jgi:hypothetical protein